MSKRTTTSRAPSRKTASKKRSTAKKAISKIDDPVVQDWKSMFVIAEHWKSDLDFFLDELNFFRTLINKYLMSLIDEKHIKVTLHLVAALKQFDKKRSGIDADVKLHLTRLTDLIQNPFAQDSHLSANKHQALEGLMADFVKNFKSLKKEAFSLAEIAMESDKAKHLLGA